MTDRSHTLQDYMANPYTRELIPDGEGGFVGRVRELPGCLTQGESMEETFRNLEEAMELWLETALDLGRPIPDPVEGREYSGRLLLRLPPWLHGELTEYADREEVSLNMLLVSLLAEAMGRTRRLGAEMGPTVDEDVLEGEATFTDGTWQVDSDTFQGEWLT